MATGEKVYKKRGIVLSVAFETSSDLTVWGCKNYLFNNLFK